MPRNAFEVLQKASTKPAKTVNENVVEPEFTNMLRFFVAQLRWEYALLVSVDSSTGFAEFDREVAEGGGDASDLVAMTEDMDNWFASTAKGDRWVPFHTILCDQERFIMEHMYSKSASTYTPREVVVLATAFSGSRWCPVFEEEPTHTYPQSLS